MWRNYLTVAVRALVKNRTYTLINIIGLALGLAACLMILIYVRYETSYDAWLPNAERTYQLQQSSVDVESGDVMRWQATAYAAGLALKKDFPQVEQVVYMMEGSPKIVQDGQSGIGEDVRFTDGNLFEVIELPFVRGDRRTALSKPGDLVLTQSEAIRRFGTENAIGRTLTFVRGETAIDYRITGIVRDLPKNSHMTMSMVARFDPKTFYGDDTETFMTSWGWVGGAVYVRLKPGADPAEIHAAMPTWEKRNIPNWVDGPQVTNAGTTDDWTLVNVRDVHLGEAQQSVMTPGNDRPTITTFTIVAVLILALACINFVNLATARASQRAREVALRKVLGANRRQLIVQFLSESLIVTLVAMLGGLAIAEIGLPALSAFLDADLRMRYLGDHGMLPPILALVAFVAVAGGLYPAFYLSRFQPASVLKANKSATDTAGSGRLRTILVVAQFAISIGLIVCTAVIYSQTLYARTVDPGFRREGLLQVTGFSRPEVEARAESLAREIARVPGVTKVARTNVGVDAGGGSDFFVYRPGNPKQFRLFTHRVDTEFFPTMGMELLAGRNFSVAQGRDVGSIDSEATPEQREAFAQRGINVILNASGAARLGFADPKAAVGQPLLMPDFAGEEYGQIPATIVGIVNDVRLRSVRDPLQPSVYRYSPTGLPFMEVRYSGADPAAVREAVEGVWKRHVPDVPFEGDFAEEITARLYSAETARGQIFASFALFAVFIGCMGLFGLAAFTAQRRTKEIGIRKVLGARTRDIVQLLVWQFTRPVLVANLIAWPVAWWVMRDWLNTFDARIALTPGPFVLAGLIALAIAIGTVSGHAMRVARANPIHALRYE
jgi:putative ABC transport system permease protein